MKTSEMKYLYILIIIYILSWSCSNDDASFQDDILISTAPLVEPDQIIERIEVVSLAVDDKDPITSCRYVYTYGDHFYLLVGSSEDDSSILIYGLDGGLIHAIRTTGRGPSEFMALSNFVVSPVDGSVFIADASNKKILQFDRNGDFVEERRMEDWIKLLSILDCSSEYRIITSNARSMYSDDTENYELFLYSDSYEPISKYLPFNEAPSIGMGNGFLFSVTSNKCGYYRMFTNEIVYINCDGSTSSSYIHFDKPILKHENVISFMQGDISLDEVITLIDYYENESARAVKYTHGGLDFLCINDPSSGNTKLIEFPSKESCSVCSNIVGVGLDEFIFAVEEKDLKELLNFFDPQGTLCVNCGQIQGVSEQVLEKYFLVLINFK